MSITIFLILVGGISVLFCIYLLLTRWRNSSWFDLTLIVLLILMVLSFVSEYLEIKGNDILDSYESFLLPMAWSFFFFANLNRLKVMDLNKIQDQLKDSNRRFHLVTETIQDMFWLETPNLDKQIFISSGYNTVFGDHTSILLSKVVGAHNWIEAISPEGRSQYLHTIKRSISEGQSYTIEYQIRNEIGNIRWILEKGYPVKNELGKIEMVAGVCSNITDRKSTELALKKSEEKLRIILSSIGDAVITTDTDGRVEWLNRIAEKLTGWSQMKAHGQQLAEVFRIIYNDNKNIVNPAQAVLSTGKIVELTSDAILLNQNGTQYHIADSAAPIKDDQGNTHGVVIAFSDITANYALEQQIRDSKERLELAISGAQLGTWDWDINSGTVIYNDRWVSMLGYSMQEVKQNFSFWENLVHPEDLPQLMKNLTDHLNGTVQFFENEHRLRSKSGDWIWVLAKGRVIQRDIDGQPLRACGTYLDITSRKKTQQELLMQQEHLGRMNEKLLNANKNLDLANSRLKELDILKNDFISMASHELRTPVTSVLGFAQTLLNPGLVISEPKRDQYLKIIEKEAIRLSKLINDLLNISKIESGHTILDMKCVSIENVAREAISSMHPDPEKQIEIINLEQGKRQVLCNRDEIVQVFVNIVENALRYGDKVIVKIGGDRSNVVISIHDNGPGIAAHQLKVIFEKFYRIQGEGKPGLGSGLGLAIAKDIITAHGGKIWAESKPGEGSTFYFTLKKC